jgi:hypothetical protein
MAALFEFYAGQNTDIGYALWDDPDATADANGKLVTPNGRGLSCVTFVLVLIRRHRFPLIDMTNWPVGRHGDKEWQEQLLKMLEAVDPAHAIEVRREVASGWLRVRPEQVAGAALYPQTSLPACHQLVEDAGFFILGGLCLREQTGIVGMT